MNGLPGVRENWGLQHRCIGIDFPLGAPALLCMVYMKRATPCLLRCKSVFNNCHRNLKVDCFAITVEINECETPEERIRLKTLRRNIPDYSPLSYADCACLVCSLVSVASEYF